MSENQNRGIHELAKYDAMTTEELEAILRLDAEAPEGQESDTETLLYVMEVLAKRKRNNGHTGNTALEAYESFKKNYMPDVEDNVALPERRVKPRGRSPRWLRGLSAAAAVLVIVFLGSVTAKAFGLDIWETVVKWTQETFHFGDGQQSGDGPDTDGELEFASLQDALAEDDIEEPLVPTWIPEGYELTDITVEETPMRDVFIAQYRNKKSEIQITVRNHLNSNPQYVEQSDGLVEAYEVAGITYYLFTNQDQMQAVWITGSFECHILGDLTIEELKMMIDSIRKG